jgi:MarR family transcriptional regulator, lower aerobic nicotinate degradation pathway regulator
MAQVSESTVARTPYGLLLARLGQEATARFRRSLRPLNLGAQQFIVLKQLQVMGPTSQSGLADALGIDYSNLASVTAELYERGLIERARDESDRRRYVLGLTSECTQLLADADLLIAAGEDDMLSALSDDERRELWDLLRRLADTLQLCPQSEAEACAEVTSEPETAG